MNYSLPTAALGMLASMCPISATRADAAKPSGGALAEDRLRVVISSDIGGSDPDDFQSLVHYFLYADLFDTEGLISSPPAQGRKKDILAVIDAYEKDYPNLKRHSERYPAPEDLRGIARQGATDPSPKIGFADPTEGSRWIVERAKADDPRSLWILVWGSITDLAQALYDAPEIKPKLRVYAIGAWNTQQDQAARDYVHREHPDLWIIECDTTFRGMYMGGNQEGDLDNKEFIARHVKGHGALGDFLFERKPSIKMGDTPSVLYLLRGNPEDCTGEHWGGSFVATGHGPRYCTDAPDPALAEGNRGGAKTVNRWREAYLRDWQARMDRVLPNNPPHSPRE